MKREAIVCFFLVMLFSVSVFPIARVRAASQTYSVNFTESGLPSGVGWWVDLNGDNHSSASNVIGFFLPNGTYTYSTGASGYTVFPSSGSATVNGADVNQAVAFTQGLPSTITIIPYSGTVALVSDASSLDASEAIGYANMAGDLWNIASNSVGNVTMTINQQGRLTTSAGFSNANTGSNPANIVGYPHVVYGHSPWAEAKTMMSKALQLPIQLGNFPQFVSLANYSISLGSSSTPPPINFAYDIWITQNKSSSGCGVGDLELMIWTYNTNNLPAGGGGTFVDSKQLPVYLEDTVQPATWNVYVRNGDQSSGSYTTVYIVSSNPVGSGAVGVDIHQMIGEMIDALLVNYPKNWNNASFQDYWIEDIELGSEFGLLQSQATYSWNLNNYCYFLNYPPLANGDSSFTCSNAQSTSTTGTTTINSGSASLNQLPATDISVSITGSSAQDGTDLTVTSTDYGANQPLGTGTLQVNGVAFYDVKISSSSPLGSNAMAVVSITSPDFSAQDDVVSFWNGSSWVPVASQFITPDTVRGTFFVSTLLGTPIMAGAIPELPSILILPLFMIATLLTATIHRKRKILQKSEN